MRLEISETADAAYAYVVPYIPDGGVDHCEEVGDDRVIDYDVGGNILGYEFLTVKHGVDLSGLPHRDELARVFTEHHIRVLEAR